MNKHIRGHLVDFYKTNQMSPVNQDISNLQSHFEKRELLFRHLGVPPALLEEKKIIEFGPGNGQNAVFTNSLFPKTYVFVDGNPYSLNTTKELLQKNRGCKNLKFVEISKKQLK